VLQQRPELDRRVNASEVVRSAQFTTIPVFSATTLMATPPADEALAGQFRLGTFDAFASSRRIDGVLAEEGVAIA
jgi:hypothetical protein